jgi:hypothetical protein
MKLFTGWVMAAGLAVAATAAQAQVPAPYGAAGPRYQVVTDVGGPYAAMPRDARVPAGYGPRLLPPEEVYTVLRESGFSPLGIPRQRGFVYTISVIDRGGDDGRLVIDARTGRILRFLPAYRMGDNFDEALTDSFGPPGPPPVTGMPRPPRAAPKVASRTTTVPLPKPSPHMGDAKPLAARPATPPVAQQSAAAPQPSPVEPATTGQAVGPATAAPVEAKPAPLILPTLSMPAAQGLE